MDWATQTDDVASFAASSKSFDILETLKERQSIARPAARIGSHNLVTMAAADHKQLSQQYALASQQAVAQGDATSVLAPQLPPSVRQLASDAFYEMLERKQDQTFVFL